MSARAQADQFSLRAVDLPFARMSNGATNTSFVRFDPDADGQLETFEYGRNRPLTAILRLEFGELIRSATTRPFWPEAPRMEPLFDAPTRLLCVGERLVSSTIEQGAEILAGMEVAPIHRQVIHTLNDVYYADGYASGNPSLPYALFTGGTSDLRSHSSNPFSPLWQDSSESTVGLALAQLDLDAAPELIVARPGVIEVRNVATGVIEDNFVTGALYVRGLMVGNIDDDPQPEVIASGDEMLHAFDVAPLRVKWQRTGLAINDIQMVDRDGDGKSEFLAEIRQPYENLAWFDSNGVLNSSVESEDLFIEALGLADVNNDNVPEVIEVGEKNYRVHSTDLSSTLFERRLVTGPFTRFEIADLDGDGRDEIVSLTSDRDYPDPAIPNLRVVDAVTGRQLWETRLDFDNENGGLAVGQMDADPGLEILLTGEWGFNPDYHGVIIVDGVTRTEQQRVPLNVPTDREFREIAIIPPDASHANARLVAALAPETSSINGIRLAEYEAATWARLWLGPELSGQHEVAALVAMQADDDAAIEVVVNTPFWGSFVFDLDSHLLQSSFSPGSRDAVALPGGRIAYARPDDYNGNFDPAVVVVDSRSGAVLQQITTDADLFAIASVPGDPDRVVAMSSERLYSASLSEARIVGMSAVAGLLNGHKSNGRLLTRTEAGQTSFLFGNEIGIWESKLQQREEPQFADGFEVVFE